MKLLTLNCHSWQEENQIEKIKYLAKVIQEEEYDVIALQEVSQSIGAKNVCGNKKEDNFGLLLLEELKALHVKDYNITWDFSHIGYDVYEEGLAIITKHNVVKEDTFFISENKDTTYWKTRKIVSATIAYNGKNITFYSCHLGWWNDEEESFKDQVNRLMEHVDSNEFSFLMGDFNNNARLQGEGYEYMMQKGLYDTYELAIEKDEGTTVQGEIAGWDENKHNLRIDLILCNRSEKVRSSKVIFNGTNRNIISDHFGVEVQVDI